MKILSSGENFLLYQAPHNIFIIFATENNLRRLSHATHWYMDGTFDSSPRLYQQLFTIHVFVGEKQFPMIYVLITNKTRAGYNDLFRRLKDAAAALHIHLNPTVITCDFESGLLPSIRDEFPLTRIQGCYFHFSQAIYRNMASLGFQRDYALNPDIRTVVRQLMALAFLPPALVMEAFEQQRENAPIVLLPLFEYFNNEWIPNIPLWNVYGVERRTNNDVEGWHLRINKVIGRHHPNIWTLVDALKEEQSASTVAIHQAEGGVVLVKKNRDYARVSQQLTALQQRFDAGLIDTITYVRGCAHNLSAPKGF
jgi:hypothetical protein